MRQEGKVRRENNRVTPKKVFLYTLAIGLVAGGAYLTYDYLKKRKEDQGTTDEEVSSNATALPERTSSSSSLPRVSMSDNFPLRKGSRGTRVMQLQKALESILGSAALKRFTAVDGVFGSGTQAALKAAGYVTSIDETTFNRLTGGYGTAAPKDKAAQLYTFSVTRNIEGVLGILSQLKSTSDYSLLNDEYKKLTEARTFVTKTIVTDLLDMAFRTDESAKQKIKTEFLRMGLKLDNATGKWSLSGLSPKRDVITRQWTIVTDSKGRKLPVKKNVILGEEIRKANGMVSFKTVDGFTCQVPARDVVYVK